MEVLSNFKTHLLAIHCVELLHCELHDFRNFIQESFEAPCIPTVEDNWPSDGDISILNQSDFLWYPQTRLGEGCGVVFTLDFLGRSLQIAGWLAVPWRACPLASSAKADGCDILLVRAQVATPILQLVQSADAVYPPWSCYGSHPKRQGDSVREVIHKSIEAFKATLVNGHLDTSKLRVPTLIEGYLLGRRHLSDSIGPSHRGEGLVIVVGAGGGEVVRR